jgi:hypothetical protein
MTVSCSKALSQYWFIAVYNSPISSFCFESLKELQNWLIHSFFYKLQKQWFVKLCCHSL